MKLYMKKIGILLTICLGFALFYGCGGPPQTTQELLNKALEEAKRGEWHDALDYLETVTEREPNKLAALIFQAPESPLLEVLITITYKIMLQRLR